MMIQVTSPNKFPEDGFIAFFSGKDYDDSIRLAGEWAVRDNTKLISYFPQVAHGKSILVCYKMKINEDNN